MLTARWSATDSVANIQRLACLVVKYSWMHAGTSAEAGFAATLRSVEAIVRRRFVALSVGRDWIELSRVPMWMLSTIDGAASLSLTMFRVAEGVTMTLATLWILEHERRQALIECRQRLRRTRQGVQVGGSFVDQTSWTEGPIFCLATTERDDFPVFAFFGRRGCDLQRHWTVSDGKRVFEATLHAGTEGAFGRAAEACERIVRSVRFEEPN
jgi:hypothetical protein